MLLFAQAADVLGSSTGILGILLGSALLTAVISAYRFAVNFRTTERGLSRKRIRDANQNERKAIYEAGLWQGRSADLEYLLRSFGHTVPPLSEELRKLILEEETPAPPVKWDNQAPNTGERPGP